MPAYQLRKAQLDWGRAKGLNPTKAGYCASPDQNLPWLSDGIRGDFAEADGDEFGDRRGFAKIAALHSSSALAVNFFGYWLSRDYRPLQDALGLPARIHRIRFERKFATGVGSRSPNLDVVLYLGNTTLWAIESKFCEPFSSHSTRPIQAKYFSEKARRWEERGLPGAEAAAEKLRDHNPYTFLDAPQLLKHMLGLACQPDGWFLQLLWYRPQSDAGRTMEREIRQFQQGLGSDAVRFGALSYQDLWDKLGPLLGRDASDYRDYLRSRYFPIVVA